MIFRFAQIAFALAIFVGFASMTFGQTMADDSKERIGFCNQTGAEQTEIMREADGNNYTKLRK